MTANQIYELTPIKIEKNTYSLNRFCDFHIPELNSLSINNKMNEHVEIKFYADYSFDVRRYWELTSIWYKNKPVMIAQNAGREGSDHIRRFITDSKAYFEMVDYLSTLCKNYNAYANQIINGDKDINELTEFYSNSLEDFYDKDFTPEYKAGTILNIKVPKEPEQDGVDFDKSINNYETVKVQITDVEKVVCEPYTVIELERKIHWGKDKNFIVKSSEIENYKNIKFDDIYFKLDKDLNIVRHKSPF